MHFNVLSRIFDDSCQAITTLLYCVVLRISVVTSSKAEFFQFCIHTCPLNESHNFDLMKPHRKKSQVVRFGERSMLPTHRLSLTDPSAWELPVQPISNRSTAVRWSTVLHEDHLLIPSRFTSGHGSGPAMALAICRTALVTWKGSDHR